MSFSFLFEMSWKSALIIGAALMLATTTSRPSAAMSCSVSVAGAREGCCLPNATNGATYNTGIYTADPLAHLTWPTECSSWSGDLILNNTTYNLPVSGYGCFNKIEIKDTGTNVTLGPGR